MAKGETNDGGDGPNVKMPPGRSGPKVLVVIAVIVLVFLAVLWYASFVALKARGPDRAFFEKESWVNGTVLLTLTDLDEVGEVPLSTVTINITTQEDTHLYSGTPGRTVAQDNYTLTVEYLDRDNSTTVTRGDQVRIQAVPAEASAQLDLTTFYLYSNGREWSRLPLT